MSEIIKSKKFKGVYYNILKDKTKSYFIRYTDPITKKKVKLTLGNSKRDGMNEIFCHNERARIISSLKFGENPNIPILKAKQQKTTLNDIAKKYFDSKLINGASKSTKDRQSRYYKHYGNTIGGLPLQMITKNDVIKIQKDLISLSYANSTINSMIQLGSTVFKYGIDEGIYKGINPFSSVKGLNKENKRERYLTKDEIKILKQNVLDDEVLYAFVLLALTTGGRLETILNIQKKDINIANNIINLYDFKNGSYYIGTLTTETKQFLEAKLKTFKDNDFIVSYDKKYMDRKKIQRRLRPILNNLFNTHLKENDRVNRVVIHTLRHTFASLLAIDGISIYTIQKLMNHKDIKQTSRYAKLSPDSGINAVMSVFD